MSFRVIRLSEDYQLAVLVSPADATPETQDAKFYLYRYKFPERDKLPVFNEVDRNSAICYFSGHADGFGWGNLPQEPFESVDEAAAYVKNKANEWARQKLVEMGVEDKDGEVK